MHLGGASARVCLIADVTVIHIGFFRDQRGWLAEIFRRDELEESLVPEMGYISVTLPGHSRGPHEHLQQTDQFAFLGPGDLELHLWDSRVGSSTVGQKEVLCVGAANPCLVTIPPGIVHGYRNLGLSPAWVLNFPNQLYAGEGKSGPVDELRHEDDPSSPYQFE